MTILYSDPSTLVCVKPAGINSTDIPGGLPDLVRQELNDPNADLRTVHRLDQVTGGIMVLAKTSQAASELSRQVREGLFQKDYLAICHFRPSEDDGVFQDLLLRDPAERKSHVVKAPGKNVQDAKLEYRLISRNEGLSLIRVHLLTGRTHQIRVQFSSRGLPLYGDRKYSRFPDPGPLGLWSFRISFEHPESGQMISFVSRPPETEPWNRFPAISDL